MNIIIFRVPVFKVYVGHLAVMLHIEPTEHAYLSHLVAM